MPRAGLLTEETFALVCNDAVFDSSRVPSGKALMKLVIQPVPYQIRHGDWDKLKEEVADRYIDLAVRNTIPNLREKILKRVVLSPCGSRKENS